MLDKQISESGQIRKKRKRENGSEVSQIVEAVFEAKLNTEVKWKSKNGAL